MRSYGVHSQECGAGKMLYTVAAPQTCVRKLLAWSRSVRVFGTSISSPLTSLGFIYPFRARTVIILHDVDTLEAGDRV